MDFNARVVAIDEYLLSNKLEEGDYYEHSYAVKADDEGQIIKTNCKLTFGNDGLIMNQIFYFVPAGQGIINPNPMIAELLYQTFARMAGYVFAVRQEKVLQLPTVQQLLEDIDNSELQSF